MAIRPLDIRPYSQALQQVVVIRTAIHNSYSATLPQERDDCDNASIIAEADLPWIAQASSVMAVQVHVEPPNNRRCRGICAHRREVYCSWK